MAITSTKTSKMVDFHTHILPQLDDGSRSLTETLELLRMEAEQGITEVMLTPHFYASQNSPETFLERRERAWNLLVPQLTQELPAVRLGAEVQYFEGICAVEDLDRLCLAGTNLLLLEMPFSRWSSRVLHDLFELNSRGDLQIVLAHIERYLPMQQKHTLQQLLEEQVLIQSNVSFFTDWRTRRKAKAMLARNEIHIVGSDCHRTEGRAPNWERLSRRTWQQIQEKNLHFAEYFLEGADPIHV